jgi:hypothetical protein
MANDSSLLPFTNPPPGSATQVGDNTGVAFNYSPHLDRIVTALEQISLSMAFVADKIDNISDKLTDISNKATIDSQNLQDIRDIFLGEKEVVGAGIPIKDVYSALAYSSLIKVFEEEGVDIDALIAKTKSKLEGL